MRKTLPAVTSCLVSLTGASGSFAAETVQPATDAPYAVGVETLTLGKAKGRFFKTAVAAGNYNFFTSASVERSGGVIVTAMGSTKEVALVRVKFRFAKSDGAPVSKGECVIESKSWAGLWSEVKNGLYVCQLDGQLTSSYTIEVTMPNIVRPSDNVILIEKTDPDKYKTLKAKMLYKGVTYEAFPTALDEKLERYHRRVAQGYIITRENKTVGRVDFQPNSRDKGKITVPAAEEDGREAVIFLCLQLLAMPEADSPALQ